MVRFDGDGWTRCQRGHRHWGRHGAAGLLLTCKGDVLLQLRAAAVLQGGTWAIPGGARDSHETYEAAALRETAEEAGVRARSVKVESEYRDDHGGWAYVTVIGSVESPIHPRPNWETAELRWVPIPDVESLPLHFGFAESWPHLRVLLEG